MSKVRIIVKVTSQPPIDTPAAISHKTIDVESEELHSLLIDEGRGALTNTATVIGAEPLTEQS